MGSVGLGSFGSENYSRQKAINPSNNKSANHTFVKT